MSENTENSLIVASNRAVPVFELNGSAVELKKKALEASALIARVTNADSKIIAVRAQVELKRVISSIEKARKELKEPLLQAGRQLDTLCATESLELEKEFGRVSNAVKEFDDAERRRVMEEERLQREELARIEREKQAEIDRIRREQEAKEAEARRIQEEAARKVKEAADAAARLAAEAKNKQQRDAAEKARLEAEKARQAAADAKAAQDAILAQEAAKAQAATNAVEEKAGDAAYCAAKPIEITKVAGQRTTCDWEITKINEWTLLKARPDLVRKIEFDMRAIKDELKRGNKIAGVEAKEVYKADVRVGKESSAINI